MINIAFEKPMPKKKGRNIKVVTIGSKLLQNTKQKGPESHRSPNSTQKALPVISSHSSTNLRPAKRPGDSFFTARESYRVLSPRVGAV